jgi:ubiquinone biosynthesis protein UbiJ
MLQALHNLLAPAVMARLTLVINHVRAAEPAAVERLPPHAGRRIELAPQGWPSLLPPPPRLAFVVSPAGLLDWVGGDTRTSTPAVQAAADLTLRFDASNPARLMADALAGATPTVDIDGDAQFATAVNWLLQNLRWDVEGDLERLVGPTVAHPLARLGAALARGLRAALQGVASLRPRP